MVLLGLAQSAWLSMAQSGMAWHNIARDGVGKSWHSLPGSAHPGTAESATSWHSMEWHNMAEHSPGLHSTARNSPDLAHRPAQQLWHRRDGLGLAQSAWHGTAQHGKAWGWHSRAWGWKLGVVQLSSVLVATVHHRAYGLGQHCPVQHGTARPSLAQHGPAWHSLA